MFSSIDAKTHNLRNLNFYGWDEKLDGITLAEYIWIDGSGKNLRSKTKVYHEKITKLD